MNRTTRHTLIFLLAIAAAATLAPSPVSALELAPPPTEPKPALWTDFESVCLDNKQTTPGVRWAVSNTTNGKHLFSFVNEGHVVYDFTVEPGETKTGTLSSHLWEDSHRHFQIIWKSQDVVLAQITPWFNCVEPILSVSFGPVDDQGSSPVGTSAPVRRPMAARLPAHGCSAASH